VRPAINVGISVSRVGGNAQIKAMKKIAGRLRIDLAQYRALEAFAQFGAELDKASQQQLSRGARVVEVLKQPQYRPLSVENQVALIWTATGGHLDAYPEEDAQRFVAGFAEYLDTRSPEVLAAIRDTGDMSEETEASRPRRSRRSLHVVPTLRSRFGGGPGETTQPDDMKQDVGWERMSSTDERGGHHSGPAARPEPSSEAE
jgi:F0F1-type ATP synthase alpha subunit